MPTGNGGGGGGNGNGQVTKPYVQSGQPLHEFLSSFWQRQVDAAEEETPDYRHPPLPLARIKKVMKNDPDVKVCGELSRSLFYEWPVRAIVARPRMDEELRADAVCLAWEEADDRRRW